MSQQPTSVLLHLISAMAPEDVSQEFKAVAAATAATDAVCSLASSTAGQKALALPLELTKYHQAFDSLRKLWSGLHNRQAGSVCSGAVVQSNRPCCPESGQSLRY